MPLYLLMMAIRLIITLLLIMSGQLISAGPKGYASLQNEESCRILHFNNENGLPQNSITGLGLDKLGNLWIGTQGGLTRFNGYLFEDKSGEIENPRVMQLRTDIDNNILLLDENRVTYRINDRTGEVVKDSLSSLDGIFGYLYALRRKPIGESKNGPFHSDISVRNIHVTQDRNVYLHYEKEGIAYLGKDISVIPGTRVCRRILTCGKYLLVQDEQFRIHYYRGDQKAGVIQHIDWEGIPDGVSTLISYAFLFYTRDNTYAIAERKLFRMRLENDTLYAEQIMSGLPDVRNISAARYDDKSGILAIGSNIDGLYIVERTPFSALYFHEYKPESPIIEISLNNIASQQLMQNGSVLADNGKIYFNGQITSTGLPPLIPFLIYRDSEGHLWAGEQGYKLIRLNNDLDIILTIPLSETIKSMAEDSPGKYWLITSNNIYHLQLSGPEGPTIKQVFHSNYSLMKIFPTGWGTFWVTSTNGLLSIDSRSKKVAKVSAAGDYYFREVKFHPEGHAWLGTYGDGYYFYENGIFKAMPMDNKNYLQFAHTFLEDQNGYTWISTNNGLFQAKTSDLLDYARGKSPLVYYHYYDKSYGFATNEFNGGGDNPGLVMPDGRFSFTTMKGLVWFDPLQARPILPEAPLVIEYIRIDGETVDKDTEKLVLKPRFQKVAIKINAPYFGHPNNLYLEYRVEGLQDEWLPVPENNLIIITSARYGNYKLVIRKLDGFGTGNISYITIPVRIKPYFRQSLWFLVTIIFGTALITYLVYRLNVLWLEDQNRKMEAEIIERTRELRNTVRNLQQTQVEILRGKEFQENVLHIIMHDLASPLRYLSNISSRLKNKCDTLGKEELASDLEALEASSKEAIHISQDLRNWVNTSQENLVLQKSRVSPDQLISRYISTYQWIGKEKGIKVEYLSPYEKEPLLLYDELTGTIIRNLLDNAVKYTRKGSVKISAQVFGQILTITVEDTGVGLSPEQVKSLNKGESPFTLEQNRHFGFRLIFDILEHLHARMKVSSQEGRGSAFSIEIPI